MSVTEFDNVNAAVYFVEIAVGVLPSNVYRSTDWLVEQLRVTFTYSGFVPPAGEILGVATVRPVLTVILKIAVAVAPVRSVTCTVKRLVPMVLGVPVMTPALLNRKPDGKVPAVIFQV